jgi:hypothetical protein
MKTKPYIIYFSHYMLALERNNTTAVESNELKSSLQAEGAEEASLLPHQFLQNCFRQSMTTCDACSRAEAPLYSLPASTKTIKGGVNKEKKQINLIG